MGKGGGQCMVIFALISSFVWVVLLLMPGRWQLATLYSFLRVDVGLYQVYITHATGAAVISGAVGIGAAIFGTQNPFADFLEGTYTLLEAQDQMCAMESLGQEWCASWSNLRVASLVMIWMGILTIIFLVLGAGFTHYYWNTKARLKTRFWMRFFFMVAPLTSTIGLLIYTFMTYEFGSTNGGSTSAMSETYGFALFNSLLISAIPLMIMEGFMRRSREEFEYENERKAREQGFYDGQQPAPYGPGAGYGNSGMPAGGGYGYNGGGTEMAAMQHQQGPPGGGFGYDQGGGYAQGGGFGYDQGGGYAQGPAMDPYGAGPACDPYAEAPAAPGAFKPGQAFGVDNYAGAYGAGGGYGAGAADGGYAGGPQGYDNGAPPAWPGQ